MSQRLRVAAIVCCATAMSLDVLGAGEQQAANDVPAASGTTELAGIRCQIWTIWEGEKGSRSSTCYEGVLKAINKERVTIVAERSRVRKDDSLFGFDCVTTKEWTPMARKEITIPMDRVDRLDAIVLRSDASENSARKLSAGESIPSTATDLAGVACQIWTTREGGSGHRTSTYYDGTLKSIDKKTAVIVAQRWRTWNEGKFMGVRYESTDAWAPLGGKEVVIPVEKVESIRFLK